MSELTWARCAAATGVPEDELAAVTAELLACREVWVSSGTGCPYRPGARDAGGDRALARGSCIRRPRNPRSPAVRRLDRHHLAWGLRCRHVAFPLLSDHLEERAARGAA